MQIIPVRLSGAQNLNQKETAVSFTPVPKIILRLESNVTTETHLLVRHSTLQLWQQAQPGGYICIYTLRLQGICELWQNHFSKWHDLDIHTLKKKYF